MTHPDKITQQKTVRFIDNRAATKERYMSVDVDVSKTLQSWQESLFSFQWLNQDGSIKTMEELSEDERPKRQIVEAALKKEQEITKPILGIGIQDNIEIGSGRAEFLTLAAHGFQIIPVHIPKSNEKDFKDFLADVGS